MKKVKCIKKPNNAFTVRDVSVNKSYDVINTYDDDYKLIDDNGKERYYHKKHFIEIFD